MTKHKKLNGQDLLSQRLTISSWGGGVKKMITYINESLNFQDSNPT